MTTVIDLGLSGADAVREPKAIGNLSFRETQRRQDRYRGSTTAGEQNGYRCPTVWR